MKTNYKLSLIALCVLPFAVLNAQVPNGGFENWTTGEPDNWHTDNVSTIVVPVTLVTPSHSGASAAKGEVVSFSGSPYGPLLSSTDASLNGFTISQSYANFSFYYKMLITGTAVFEVHATLYDASGGWVADGGQFITAGTVSSFTLANYPLTYGSANPPVECVILFTIHDTLGGDPPVGNYFIVDDVALSGIASLNEQAGGINLAQAFPSPATDLITITHSDALNGKTEITVYDLLGNVVKNFSSEISGARFEQKFSVAELLAGIYPVRITSAKKQWLTKIVKQ